MLAVALPAFAGAQWPVTVEVTAGIGRGHTSGEYRSNRTGVTGEVLVGAALQPLGSGRWTLATTLGVQGSGPLDASCIPRPDGSCVPGFPDFELASILAGWETGSGQLRILTGPAAARGHGDWRNVRVAWLSRLDVATRARRHLALIGSLRSALVPAYRGDRFLLASLGLGVRLR